MTTMRTLPLLTVLLCAHASAGDSLIPLGIFEGQTDIGKVLHAGTAEYDAASKTYTLSGSGDNMWFAKDEFHFVWKKISAEDLTFTAKISNLGAGGNGHRKGVLIVRQSLNDDDAYVDVAQHAEGLTSLQFRDKQGDTTHEIESNISGPSEVRLEKRGNRFYMWVAAENQELQFAGGSAWVEMRAPFYVGIGVCAHDKNAIEKASFTGVELDTEPERPKHKNSYSTIETILLSGDARTGYVSQKHLASPGWSADGQSLTYEADKHTEQTPFTPLRTAAPVGPPVPVKPEKNIFFAKESGGNMQIWRKNDDGSESEQFSPDDFNNTSPHVSPDGKYLLFLRYTKQYAKLTKNTPVELRLMTISDGVVKTLTSFFGGPASLGPEPWSPDGKRIVFVSYQAGADGP